MKCVILLADRRSDRFGSQKNNALPSDLTGRRQTWGVPQEPWFQPRPDATWKPCSVPRVAPRLHRCRRRDSGVVRDRRSGDHITSDGRLAGVRRGTSRYSGYRNSCHGPAPAHDGALTLPDRCRHSGSVQTGNGRIQIRTDPDSQSEKCSCGSG